MFVSDTRPDMLLSVSGGGFLFVIPWYIKGMKSLLIQYEDWNLLFIRNYIQFKINFLIVCEN